MGAARVDLNLLLVFEAVLRTRNTTSAAIDLDITQSAVSNALNRLRKTVNDPLFVRTAEGMAPTPKAEAIAPQLLASLDQIRQTLFEPPKFDPGTSRRSFRTYMSEGAQLVLMTKLLEEVETEAPGVTLEILQAVAPRDQELALSRGEADLAVGCFSVSEGPYHVQGVLRQAFACVVSPSHPFVAGDLTLQAYLDAIHAVHAPSSGETEQVEQQIESLFGERGLRRRVALRSASLFGVAQAVAATGAVATLPRAVAKVCASLMGLRTFAAPIPLPMMEVHQYWHHRYHHDAGNQWLRRRIASLFAEHNDLPIQSSESVQSFADVAADRAPSTDRPAHRTPSASIE